MKNYWVKAGILVLAAAVTSCRKEIPVAPAPEIPPVQTKLAHIDIVTDNNKPVDSKETADYRPCTITVTGGDQSYEMSVRGKIRGRGNSTWNWYPKKPYRIKLDQSASFMGLPENKDWVLMADYRDVTHMMNATGFYLAEALGLPCANHSRYATVTLNGKEIGLYMVTEQVEEGGNRVKLDKEEGILLALDLNDGPSEGPRGAINNFWSKVFEMACAVKSPEVTTKTERNAVKAEFAILEDAINKRNWAEIQELLNVDSMINYILIQEIICNVEMDNNPSLRSGYIHRHDKSTRWVMGPLWDCDGGFCYNWGDMYDSRGWGHTYFEDYRKLIFGTDPYRHTGAYGATASDFFCRLFGNREFVLMMKDRWNENHEELLSGLLEYLDEVEDLIGEAAAEDVKIWGIKNYTHSGQVWLLRGWLVKRFEYLDGVINNYPVRN